VSSAHVACCTRMSALRRSTASASMSVCRQLVAPLVHTTYIPKGDTISSRQQRNAH
jgi:hypothetical protein